MKGAWWVDFRFQGERYRRKSPVDNKRGAEEYERKMRQQLLDGPIETKEVPTFEEWFHGRYWREWVVSQKNKSSTAESKKSIYEHHLKDRFGGTPIDKIGVAQIAEFRASLVQTGLSDKTINNILAVLSKPLRYAVDAEEIARAPKVGLLKIEPKEMLPWEFGEYVRILGAARAEGPIWYAAVCLAGEAGLRVGEIRALRWREDVDLVAESVTVNQQRRHGVVGTPKGRTRRTVPMTRTLLEGLKQLDVVRTGHVIRNLDGTPVTDGQTTHAIYRICRRAGLPDRGWHALRHSYGTHAALFGVNPWRLMTWMGHKRIDQTMNYVHVADAHRREWPQPVAAAASTTADPDRRILAMLGARAQYQAGAPAGQGGHPVGTAADLKEGGAENF
jgi:integrase